MLSLVLKGGSLGNPKMPREFSNLLMRPRTPLISFGGISICKSMTNLRNISMWEELCSLENYQDIYWP